VTLDPDEPEPITGVVDDVASDEFLGVRSATGLHRIGAEGDAGCTGSGPTTTSTATRWTPRPPPPSCRSGSPIFPAPGPLPLLSDPDRDR
jgi:hypothetical protein